MTLKEVLLVFGGHVGLLIYSLKKDGNPRHMRGGRCQEAPWGGLSFGGRVQGVAFSSKMERPKAEFMQNGKGTQEFRCLASAFVSNPAVPSLKFS